MISFDANLIIRREIDRELSRHGVEVNVVMEFDNTETMKRAIEIDAGIGLLAGADGPTRGRVGHFACHSAAQQSSDSTSWNYPTSRQRAVEDDAASSSSSCCIKRNRQKGDLSLMAEVAAATPGSP